MPGICCQMVHTINVRTLKPSYSHLFCSTQLASFTLGSLHMGLPLFSTSSFWILAFKQLLCVLLNWFCCQLCSGVLFFGIPSYDSNSSYFSSHALPIFARFFCSTQLASFALYSLQAPSESWHSNNYHVYCPTKSFANFAVGFLSSAFPRIFWTQCTSSPMRCLLPTYSLHLLPSSPWPT